MSLYQSGNQQQKQMFGVPGGVYMSQQQQQQQRGNAFPMQGKSSWLLPKPYLISNSLYLFHGPPKKNLI